VHLNEWAAQLRAAGFKVVCGSEGTLWVSHEGLSMVRVPEVALHSPSRAELPRVFWQSWVVIVSAVEPSPRALPTACSTSAEIPITRSRSSKEGLARKFVVRLASLRSGLSSNQRSSDWVGNPLTTRCCVQAYQLNTDERFEVEYS